MTIQVNLQLTPVLSNNNVDLSDNKIKWDRFSNNDINNYCSYTDVNLGNVRLHTETFACTDLNCENANHKNNIDILYQDITRSLIVSGEKIANSNNKKFIQRPGWNDYVSDLYEASRETRLL